MIGDFIRNYVIFFPVCKDAGLNVKLDLPDVMKVKAEDKRHGKRKFSNDKIKLDMFRK